MTHYAPDIIDLIFALSIMLVVLIGGLSGGENKELLDPNDPLEREALEQSLDADS